MTTEEKIVEIKENIQLAYWSLKQFIVILFVGCVAFSIFTVTASCLMLGCQDFIKMITELKNLKP